MKMQTININLIVKHKTGTKWENAGEHALPVLPRIAEHIALSRSGDIAMYKVVSIIHAVPFEGLTEVFAVYVGTLHEVQDKLLSS
jgi:hypothetical protein